MQSRLMTAAIVSPHAGANSQSAKDILRRIPRQRGSIAGQEQCRVRSSGVLLGTPSHIGLQDTDEIRAHGYQPRLIEFALADRENTHGQIDIGECEGKGFADP